MAMTLSLQLSDGLADLRLQFEEFTSGTRVLEPHDARIYVTILKVLYQQARDFESEVSQKRRNDAAREEAEAASTLRRVRETLALIEELQRPDTNVTPFPNASRPFSDGLGGAA